MPQRSAVSEPTFILQNEEKAGRIHVAGFLDSTTTGLAAYAATAILAAVRTNPHLRLIIVNPSADDFTARPKEKNKYWETLFGLAKQGEDVWLINATFGDFAEIIPDLKSLTPAQRLTRDIKQLAGTK
jgi:hypothetical protein